MALGNFQCPVGPTNLNNSWQGPTVFAVCIGEGCLDIFISSFISLFISLSLGGWAM